MTPFVVHVDDVEEGAPSYPAPFDEVSLSLGKDLSGAAGGVKLGAWHDRLPPGHRTGFLHAHQAEEELIYVLSGTPTLLWALPGSAVRREPLRTGSFVAFPAGTGLFHAVENRGKDDAVLLVVGERRDKDKLAWLDPVFGEWFRKRRPQKVWSPSERPAQLYVTTCSAEKDPRRGLMPAVKRYTGERVKEAVEEADELGLPLAFLSGALGLVPATMPIPWYDHALHDEEVAGMVPRLATALLGVREVLFHALPEQTEGWGPYHRALRGACEAAGVKLTLA